MLPRPRREQVCCGWIGRRNTFHGTHHPPGVETHRARGHRMTDRSLVPDEQRSPSAIEGNAPRSKLAAEERSHRYRCSRDGGSPEGPRMRLEASV